MLEKVKSISEMICERTFQIQELETEIANLRKNCKHKGQFIEESMPNDTTKFTRTCDNCGKFEISTDYLWVKIPRWEEDK